MQALSSLIYYHSPDLCNYWRTKALGGPSSICSDLLLCSVSFGTQWAGSAALQPPRTWSLPHRFQVPVDEDSQHLQNTYDGSVDGETQAR